MELLNLSFVILVIKITISVLPGVLGIYLIVVPEETKRGLRNSLCNRLFGVSNAIPYEKFLRTCYISGAVLLLVSGGLGWLLLVP